MPLNKGNQTKTTIQKSEFYVELFFFFFSCYSFYNNIINALCKNEFLNGLKNDYQNFCHRKE